MLIIVRFKAFFLSYFVLPFSILRFGPITWISEWVTLEIGTWKISTCIIWFRFFFLICEGTKKCWIVESSIHYTYKSISYVVWKQSKVLLFFMRKSALLGWYPNELWRFKSSLYTFISGTEWKLTHSFRFFLKKAFIYIHYLCASLS